MAKMDDVGGEWVIAKGQNMPFSHLSLLPIPPLLLYMASSEHQLLVNEVP